MTTILNLIALVLATLTGADVAASGAAARLTDE
jgi:hypothetical protein